MIPSTLQLIASIPPNQATCTAEQSSRVQVLKQQHRHGRYARVRVVHCLRAHAEHTNALLAMNYGTEPSLVL